MSGGYRAKGQFRGDTEINISAVEYVGSLSSITGAINNNRITLQGAFDYVLYTLLFPSQRDGKAIVVSQIIAYANHVVGDLEFDLDEILVTTGFKTDISTGQIPPTTNMLGTPLILGANDYLLLVLSTNNGADEQQVFGIKAKFDYL